MVPMVVLWSVSRPPPPPSKELWSLGIFFCEQGQADKEVSGGKREEIRQWWEVRKRKRGRGSKKVNRRSWFGAKWEERQEAKQVDDTRKINGDVGRDRQIKGSGSGSYIDSWIGKTWYRFIWAALCKLPELQNTTCFYVWGEGENDLSRKGEWDKTHTWHWGKLVIRERNGESQSLRQVGEQLCRQGKE